VPRASRARAAAGLGQAGPELPALVGSDGIEGLGFLDCVDAHVEVPRRTDDAHEVVQDERPHRGFRGREPDTRPRVLVVEDDPSVARNLARMLRPVGDVTIEFVPLAVVLVR
jgi:hypothetical protein